MRVVTDLKDRGVKGFSFENIKIEWKDEKMHKYTPDVVLENNIIIELKGYFSAKDRMKHLAIKEQHPDLDIRFCFQKAGERLNKTSKTTYNKWCEKHGFKWCHMKIPDEWIEEEAKPEVPELVKYVTT